MSMINYAAREINCKIVYYGPGLGGKTTSLQAIHDSAPPERRGKLVSLVRGLSCSEDESSHATVFQMCACK